VGDTDIARVLSWHMSADMDCVVTKTTKKVPIILLSLVKVILLSGIHISIFIISNSPGYNSLHEIFQPVVIPWK